MVTFVFIITLASAFRGGSASLSAASSAFRGGAGPTSMSAATKQSYTLTYFDARGAAELARVVLAVTGADWSDSRFPIAMQDGKPSVPEFQAAKAAGELAINMDRVPLLRVDSNGFTIGQSRAIERFLARRHGLFGVDEYEAAQIDAICEHVRDVKDAYGRAVPAFGPDGPEKEAKRDAWYNDALKGWLVRMEKSLPSSNLEHAVGSKLSLADLAIWHLLRDYFSDTARAQAAASGCPRLNGIANTVAAMPAVSGWVNKRPKTTF